MSTMVVASPVELLEERLRRGADLLFEMEQRGETDLQYDEWLGYWESLLSEYEREAA